MTVTKESIHAGQLWAVPVISLLVAIPVGTLFVHRQLHLPFPLLDFSVFRDAAFTSDVLAAAFSLFAIGGIEPATTQRFRFAAGFTPLEAGILVSAAALGSLPTALLDDAFLCRTSLRILITGGPVTGSLMVLLAIWGIAHGPGWLIVGLTPTGIDVDATMSVTLAIIVDNALVHRVGVTSSVEEISYELGSLFAVTILGSPLAYPYTVNVVFPIGASGTAYDNMTSALVSTSEAGADGVVVCQAAGVIFDHTYMVVTHVVTDALAMDTLITDVLLRRYGLGS